MTKELKNNNNGSKIEIVDGRLHTQLKGPLAAAESARFIIDGRLYTQNEKGEYEPEPISMFGTGLDGNPHVIENYDKFNEWQKKRGLAISENTHDKDIY